LVVGPSLYLYVRSFKERITFKKAWPHYIPFVVFLFWVTIIVNTLGRQYPPSNAIPGPVLHHPFTFIPISIRLIQMVVYYFLSRRSLNGYQQSLQHIFSETSRINLNWVRWLINGYLILVFATIALYALVLNYTNYFNLFILINAALFTPYIYMATFKGVTQPTIWQVQPGMNKEKVEQEMHDAEELEKVKARVEKVSQQKDPVIKDKTGEIVSGILQLMEEDKLYQETELTLQNLAHKLQVPAYQVSQAINEGMNKTFYDLVNGYRVEEAKRLLVDPRNSNYTLLSVGFDAGFNSKTTFNTVFKKFTGLTPGEYRNKEKAASALA
jgi:AraC-like DNA-binding protein